MNNILYILVLFILASLSGTAQKNYAFCNDIQDKKLISEYEKGLSLLDLQQYNKAEPIIAKIIEKQEDFVEAWLAMSEIHYTRYETAGNEQKQEHYLSKYTYCLKKVLEYCPDYYDVSIYYTLGQISYLKNDLEGSKNYFQEYLKRNKRKDSRVEQAESLLNEIEKYEKLTNNPVPFNPVVVKGVSTEDDEYLPIISPDETIILYTKSFFRKDISSVYEAKIVEEFNIARLDQTSQDNVFSEGISMPYPFNTGKNQGAASITIDNSILYVTICEYVNSEYNNCDIFYSHRIGENSWSDLINLGPNINGLYTWESQPSISADGKTLFFASIREENVGFDPNYPTSDIWCSQLQSDGSWSKAFNLGAPINTPGNEKTPFIHSDSQTLYYSSDGMLGLGGYDIFYSKNLNSIWQEPINIGYPINTKSDEVGFIVNSNGNSAYFASNKLKGVGGWDIYSFELYKEARPERVLLVRGQLFDDEGSEIKNAVVEMKNIRTDEVSEGLVNAETGNYAVAVTIEDDNKDDDFLMLVKKEDYSFTSALISVADDVLDKSVVKDFEIKPIETGKSVELNDIYFSTASFSIDTKSLKVLDSFVEFLKYNKTIKIELQGHTDNIGSVESNLVLSENRAKAVYDYLISMGIESARLQYKGLGPNEPITDNSTEEGRSKNRRTEFYIISK